MTAKSETALIGRTPSPNCRRSLTHDLRNLGIEAAGYTRLGLVGSADCRLMSLRDLVDFAVPWFDRALSAPAGKDGVSSPGSDV